ncbi:MAG: hypothetical protein KatS3mg110_0355 [Pirellulaceae bacterium]|nr:MAG: hypothetical protein KatS3mg110_0355 [Pirellulaceae bacterium]
MNFAENPFAARYVRPGTIPFVYPSGLTPRQLMERLVRCGWRGQVIGPHGSGKTSLLLDLRENWRSHRVTYWYTIAPEERTQAIRWPHEAASWHDRAVVVVDGFDRLAALRKIWLQVTTFRRKTGFIVTTHRRQLGLPVLVRLQPTFEQFVAVVEALLARSGKSLFWDRAVLLERWQNSGENMREALFSLYDAYEEIIRSGK